MGFSTSGLLPGSMQRPDAENFNIALICDEIHQSQYRKASSLFSEHTSGYLLSDDSSHLSYPHITLCQFKCESAEKAIEIFKNVKSPERISLEITKGKLRLNPAKTALWVELSVVQDEQIMSAHLKAASSIEDPNMRLTKTETYDPHISLARLVVNPESLETVTTLAQSKLTLINDEKSRLFGKIVFRLVLGASDKNGQLTKIIDVR